MRRPRVPSNAKLVLLLQITNELLGGLNAASEFAYAWQLMRDYIPLLGEQIGARVVFVKLADAISQQLQRMMQANSKV